MEEKDKNNINKPIVKCQKVICLWNATEQGQKYREGQEGSWKWLEQAVVRRQKPEQRLEGAEEVSQPCRPWERSAVKEWLLVQRP